MVKNVNAFETIKPVRKADYDNKIAGLATTSALAAAESKILNITGLATTTALKNIEKKIPTVNDIYLNWS